MRPLLALVAAAVLLVVPASAARASWRAPCVPGTQRPVCTWWQARTTFIADGDTIRVRPRGGGAVQTIRFTGINAPELTRYSSRPSRRRGACHAVAATAVVQAAIRASHRIVRLAAQRPSSRTGGRLRRSVYARVGGRWIDVSRLELDQGLALWLPNGVEWAHNAEYRIVAEADVAARRGLFAPSACGAGPDDDIPIGLTVNWDADGNDERNLDDEWIQLGNAGARDLPLAGWSVRDSWMDRYTFPAGTSVPAGGALRVRIGCGANTPSDLHWCRRRSIFENVSPDGGGLGDGGYLFDAQGDVRASMIYPCAPCSDPLAGTLRLWVHPSTPEEVTVTNVGGAPADLRPYVLKLHVRGYAGRTVWSYHFHGDATLGPGETMQLLVGRGDGEDTRLSKGMGRGAFQLTDAGNAMSLGSYTDAVVACYAWGSGGRC